MAAEPRVQEALAALEVYQRQLEAYGRQMEFLQNVLEETVRARRTLEGLSEEKSREILIPLGASTFVRGKAAPDDTVITGIGAGYAVEKTRKESVERLSQRESDLREENERLMQAMVALQQEAAQLQSQIEMRE